MKPAENRQVLSEVPAAEARWRRRKEARPGEILDAALAEFAARGFAAARMEDIAARAGVTKGTLYLYFPSKEELFKALVRESIGAAIAARRVEAEAFEGSAAELLATVLRFMGFFARTSDRAVLPKIIMAEAGNFPELLRFYRAEVVENGLALIGGIIARGVARGEFREVDPQHAARLCIAPLLLVILWRTTFAREEVPPYDLAGLVEAHIDVLLKGLAP
ncbi:MAG TPA: TetR/AcrR family transcriptional regulator [Rhizomicrobium sp.]|jgi:AcrR family transcriptional regulator|nr:TetR/AcrR family transcriptional regulator [Rhizomicrobium sp.]